MEKEPTAMSVASQEVVTIAKAEDTEMEVDVVMLNHVVENMTYGLVETETMPLGQRRANLMPRIVVPSVWRPFGR